MVEYLKKLQAAELQTLKDVKKVCERHNIRFFLSSGTAIGAIRHHGFIPWDDDIDIAMPVDDYYRFLAIAQGELGRAYFVQNFQTDKYFQKSFTRVRRNGTAMIRSNHLRDKSHQGIWIDIFPIIYIRNDKDFIRKKRLLSVCNYLTMDTYILGCEKEFKEVLKVGYYPFRLFLKIPSNLRRYAKQRILRYIFGAKGGQYLTEVYPTLKVKYPTDMFDDVCNVDFEGEKFPVPKRYDEFLSIQYGDYMKLPPEDQRVNHGDLIVSTEKSYTEIIEEQLKIMEKEYRESHG